MPVSGVGQPGIGPDFKASPGSPHVSYTEARVFRHHPAAGERGERPVRHIQIKKDQIAWPEFLRKCKIGRQIRRERVFQGRCQRCGERDVAPENAERRLRARSDPVAQQGDCADLGNRHRSAGPQHLRNSQMERVHQTIGPVR